MLISTCDPSVSTQVWVSCGEPSGIVVATKHVLRPLHQGDQLVGQVHRPSQQVPAVFRAAGSRRYQGTVACRTASVSAPVRQAVTSWYSGSATIRLNASREG